MLLCCGFNEENGNRNEPVTLADLETHATNFDDENTRELSALSIARSEINFNDCLAQSHVTTEDENEEEIDTYIIFDMYHI